MSVSSELRARLPGRPALLGAGALLAALFLAAGLGDGDRPDPVEVVRDDLSIGVEVDGEIVAVRSLGFGAPPVRDFELKIAHLAPEGSEVEKGDPLLGFDTTEQQRQLAERRAELAEVEASLEQSRLDLEVKLIDIEQRVAQAEAELGKARLKAEVPPELVARVEARKAQLDLEARRQDLDNLLAERDSTRARGEAELASLEERRRRAAGRVAELEAAIEAMTILAPQPGVVIHHANWRGEKKKIGDNVWWGETVLSIPDLTELRAEGMVDEADGGRVEVGQPVVLRLEARPELDLRGTVSSIGQSVRRRSWRVPAKVFRVTIELESADPTFMRPAMRFRGEIETERLADRVVLPRSAVFLREDGPVVYLRRWLRWSETPVSLGARDGELVEVLEGVEEGDRVLPLDLAAGESAGGAPRLGASR